MGASFASVAPSTASTRLLAECWSSTTRVVARGGTTVSNVDPVLAGRHLQLALYGRAARVNLAEDSVQVRAEFRFVSSRGKFERRHIVVDQQTDARLAHVVAHTASGIRDGAFLPMPGEFDRGAFPNCRFCEFERICSTSRDEAWRRKSPQASFMPLEFLG